MSSIGFESLAAAWLLALVPLLVLLYFLKLRRPTVRVSSLALWRQVLADRRVNSPFQKLKRSLLLLLQLLALLLLILAALQPFTRSDGRALERRLLILDASASMAAADERGVSRLDLAKGRAHALIDAMSPDQEMSVLGFAQTARQATPFTSDKRELRAAVDGLAAQEVPGELRSALEMAAGLAQTTSIDRVLLLSDGNFASTVAFKLPFSLSYEQLPAAGANIGIAGLGAHRSEAGEWSVLAQLLASEGEHGAVVQLWRDGELAASQSVVVRAEESTLLFTLPTGADAHVEVKLEPEGFDALAADNRAYLDLVAPRPLRVFVSPALGSVRRAIAAQSGVELSPDTETEPAGAEHDVVIVDGTAAAADRVPVSLTIGAIPANLGDLLELVPGSNTVVDWRRDEALLEHVELGDLALMDETRWREGATIEKLEQRGYESLIDGRSAPLMVRHLQGERRWYALLFPLDHSTLPYRVGFPILLANLTRLGRQAARLLDQEALRTGVIAMTSLAANQRYRVTGPDGYDRQEESDAEGRLAVPAPRVGVYTVKHDGQERRASVSLLSARVTSLAAAAQIDFEELKITASRTLEASAIPLWSPLVVLALVVLLIEWWYYQRHG